MFLLKEVICAATTASGRRIDEWERLSFTGPERVDVYDPA